MSAGFCPSCGKPAAADARFCAACGNALPRAQAAGETPPPPAGATVRGDEKAVFTLKPLVVRTLFESLVCVVTLGVGWLFFWIARMGRRYVVTTQRIESRRGVFNIRRESLEMFRIEDFEVVEPFFLRLRGAGHLTIRSMDKDEPVLVLEAIPDVQSVYETLRSLTRDERGRGGVRVVEVG